MKSTLDYTPDHGGPVIHASIVNGLLRKAYARGGHAAASEVAEQIVSGLTDAEVIAIASGEARLTGNTRDGVHYERSL